MPHKLIENPRVFTTQHQLKFYTPLAMLFVAFLLIANIIVQKLVPVGKLGILTAADFIFPFVYVIDGVLTEVYGYGASRRVIWLALFCNILLVFGCQMAIALPVAPEWGDQIIFAKILGRTEQIVLASFVAFVCGEFLNSYILAKTKVFLAGRFLWLRSFSSLAIGQGLDTFLFNMIAFFGVLCWRKQLVLMLSVYLFKLFYEICLLPLIYFTVNFLKRREGVYIFDRHTNFNPFRLRF